MTSINPKPELLIRLPPTFSPDGIGWGGVFFDDSAVGGRCVNWDGKKIAMGFFRCEKHACINPKTGAPGPLKPVRENEKDAEGRWEKYALVCKAKDGIYPFKGACNDIFCDKSTPQVCLKMNVVHVDRMSRSSGVLLMKRTSCTRDGKCAVFKAGLCIDLRKNVWSSVHNDHKKRWSISDAGLERQRKGKGKGKMRGKPSFTAQTRRFGLEAQRLLKKFNNRLPSRHTCSDTRHVMWFRVKKTNKKLCLRPRGTGVCTKSDDASRARHAIINY